MAHYKQVELKEGEQVIFLAVHALKWPWDAEKPTAGFVECGEEEQRLLDAAPDLLAAAVDALDFLDNAPFSMANGVEYMGIDEGEVRGARILRGLSDRLRAAIAKAQGNG